MSIASAPGSLSPSSPELLTRFLESLRRDAFVLEAYNYESPAIADNEDFQLALRPIGEQVRTLFGNDTVVLAAVDANGCKERETGNLSRQVLVGLVHPKIDIRVWPKRSVHSSDAVPMLADCILSAGGLRYFWSRADSEANQFFEENVKPNEDDQVIIAPYLVHRTVADALGAKEGKFRQLVDLWQRQRDSPDLMYTQPFSGSPGNRLALFGDAYYAAVLVVYVAPGIQLTQAHMNWLEAFHISFQTAWGFPALEEAKKAFEVKRQEAEDMRTQVRNFQRLQILAHNVSATIHENLNLMRRSLDPGEGLDSEELARLFDPYPEVIWTGKDITIRSQHDWGASQKSRNCEGIKHYAVHTILNTSPSQDLSFADLKSSANNLVTEKAQHSPVLLRFLSEVVKEGQAGFDLLKEICRMNMPGDRLRFYALAARFFLGQVREDFTVQIRPNSLRSDNIVLSAGTFLDLGACISLLEKPTFSERSNTKPKEWALLLFELVARELQSERDKATVSSVTMIEATESTPCEVICQLVGPDQNILDVLSVLNLETAHGAIPDRSKHGLRTKVSRLREARSALGPEYFNWVTDEVNKQIKFRIGQSSCN